MDVVLLSRLQFALTAMFHFIFVPLTLGLSVLVAIMETIYVKTGNELYLKMAKFWGKLFLINFALGVVTGITMEFQFGMNWAEYSIFMGDVFGAPLAIEATMAFFLESTFLGIWIFGWKKISKKTHAFAIWMVAIGSNISALWILVANAWMQHPVGYVIKDGRAQMVDFFAMFSGYAVTKFFHQILAGYTVGAFFVMGVSAYHLLRKNHIEFFKKSFKIAALFALFVAFAEIIMGDFHAYEVAKTQPTKLAAMESHWETKKGAPMYLLAFPNEAKEKNAIELLPIPNFLSFLATHDFNGEVKGLKDFPKDERPPVLITFLSFRLMVALGMLFALVALVAYYFYRKDVLIEKKWFLRLLLYMIPLPYIANFLGWTVAEVGRQPWIVYGLMKTSDAVSKSVSTSQVWMSIIGFTLFYGFLGIIDIYLISKYAKKGPEMDEPKKDSAAMAETSTASV